MKKPSDIEILIVDDHAILRQSLEKMLNSCDGISVVASAGTRSEVVRYAGELPDIILMDVDLNGDSGIEVAEKILADHPSAKIIGLSMYLEEEIARAMLQAGAAAYLTKDAASDELVATIKNLMRN